MALTSTDQLHNQELKIEQQKTEQAQAENAQLKLMISGATGQGGSPGQKYKPPVTNPGRGEAVFGTGKDGQRYFEFLKAMMIDPANNIRKTNRPLGNDDSYGRGNVPGHPDWKISHGKFFDQDGVPIQDPTRGMDPSGNPITIPHLQQTPEEAEQNRQLHIDKYHQASATSRQIRDRLKPFTKGKGYNDAGGSLRGIPDALRIQLLRDAMAQNSPANNIRRLRDSGHKTDYTGGFVLGDDGKLVPVMGIIKADAANNIRRLQESGHQTVIDDNNPKKLKIIKQFRPPRA